MPPRLRVLAGPTVEEMEPITCNINRAHRIKSPFFDGSIVVHIRGFPDEEGQVLDSEYFSRDDRKGITWSIQVQGRFLQSYSADDVMFGNTFDRPLRLPWGAGAALKFMNFIDPTLTHDLTSKTKPWALSPLVSTMPYFNHTPLHMTPSPSSSKTSSLGSLDDELERRSTRGRRSSSRKETLSNGSSGSSTNGSPLSSQSSLSSLSSTSSSSSQISSHPKHSPPTFPNLHSLNDDTHHIATPPLPTPSKRRAYFSSPSHRKAITFGPNDVITTDFCYGFIQFPQLALTLPGGISFDLMRYWDGQPVRFVCCRRAMEQEEVEDARVFWCVAIELVEEVDEDEEEEEEEE